MNRYKTNVRRVVHGCATMETMPVTNQLLIMHCGRCGYFLASVIIIVAADVVLVAANTGPSGTHMS